MLVTLGASAYALDPALAISQYQKRTWQVEQGLPQNHVNDILQDVSGELLLATESGVVRFDGLAFAPCGSAGTWAREWITALARDREGSLWAGSRRSMLYRIQSSDVRAQELDRGSSIHQILFDRTGRSWALTPIGVWRGKPGDMRKVEGLPGVASYVWHAATELGDGSIWLVTRGGLIRIRADGPERIMLPAAAGEPLAIFTDRDGQLWLGTSTGAYRVSPGPRVQFEKIPGTFGRVSSIVVDRDRNLWLGTWGSGIFRVNRNSGATRWTTSDGLPDDFVRCLFEDTEGNLWIGTRSGGVTRWKDTPIIPYGPSESLGGNYASAVARGPGGRVYLGTWRSGLYYTDGQRIHPIPLPLPASQFLVRAMAVDPRGKLWLSAWEEGLYEGGPHGLTPVTSDPEARYYTSAILFDARGALWLGSPGRGLLKYPSGRPDPRNRRLWLAGENIMALAPGRNGSVLAATSTTVVRIKDDSAHYVLGGLSVDPPGTALHEDRSGRVWAKRSGSSVAVSDGSGAHVLEERHGLPKAVMAIAEDRAGDIWMSTANGLYRVRLRQLEEFFQGKCERLSAVRFGQEDGMRSSECHGKSQPAVAQDEEGALWFPSVRGFVKVRPNRIRDDMAPLPWLRAITVGGRSQSAGGSIVVSPGTGPIEILYNAVSLTSPERLEFQYRLAGLEEQWTFAGGSRQAAYTRLPGGTYRFEVSVRRAGGDWSAPVGVAEIQQQAAFRETGWFALMLAACGGLIVASAFLLLQRLRQTRVTAVHDERQRIAREWHDTLLADFAAVSWQLEATREKIPTSEPDARASLELARAMVRHSQSEARRLINDLRETEQAVAAGLGDSIKRALVRLNSQPPVETTVEIQGDEPDIPFRRRRDILMICQEAVANALRHGHASRVRVLVECGIAGLRLAVEDDGVGAKLTEFEGLPGHFGVRGMRERAQNLGGVLGIESEPGRGTRVTLSIPPERFVQ